MRTILRLLPAGTVPVVSTATSPAASTTPDPGEVLNEDVDERRLAVLRR